MYDLILIGSGFGSLTAAALLAKRGLQVCVLEQAKYPGGCSSSYKRKGFWFETGATTLVGLDEHMPLHYLLDETGIQVPVRKLDVPMQVHLPNGELLTRYPDLEGWIEEAERVFGSAGQRAFWEHCYRVSKGVWRTSLEQKNFPFSNAKDLWHCFRQARPHQLRLLPGAFRTMRDMLHRYKLLDNKLFVDFVNEQLLITAQNHMEDVNELFGATALCYTLFGNYYVDGGLINLVRPLEHYINQQGGTIQYRHAVQAVISRKDRYQVHTSQGILHSRYLISGIPLNDTQRIFQEENIQGKLQPYLMPSAKLNGAFTMALALQNSPALQSLHHQVHVPQGLPVTGSKSYFVSFSHPDDQLRAPEGYTLLSVSTHIPDPEKTRIEEKSLIQEAIISDMERHGLLKRADIVYLDAATPGAWHFWTQRVFGMVGGYPQYQDIKPWQMKDARLDGKGAYVCGDTVYPGQGIPGTCLSGIIAAQKLSQDHL